LSLIDSIIIIERFRAAVAAFRDDKALNSAVRELRDSTGGA